MKTAYMKTYLVLSFIIDIDIATAYMKTYLVLSFIIEIAYRLTFI